MGSEDTTDVFVAVVAFIFLVRSRPQVATRKAYGMALAKLGRYNERMVVLDGDTKNSTFSELFKNEHPNRYVECYIAEQNMVRKVCSKQ